MSYNGAGAFTIDTAGNPVVADTDISPTVHNATMTELAAGLSLAICRDGQSTISENIPFNSKNITGLGTGTGINDAANIANIIQQTGSYIATVGGTGNAITLTSVPTSTITSYTAGMLVSFLATATNTSTVTIDIDGLGAKDVRRAGTLGLSASDIVSGMLVTIRYDGTRFQLQTPFYAQGSWTPSVGGDATYTTQAGRYTKFGRMVWIQMDLVINVLGTGSATTISGLPFAHDNVIGDGSLTIGDFSSLATNVVWIGARVNMNATTISLRNLTAAGASATSSNLLGNGAYVSLAGWYCIA